jgi:hypothetical protein
MKAAWNHCGHGNHGDIWRHGDIKQVAHGTIMNHINKCIFVNITIYIQYITIYNNCKI